MQGIFAFVLVTLASARLTRLLVADTVTEPLRRAVWRLVGGEVPPALLEPITHFVARTAYTSVSARRWLWKLMNCPWCSGFWISLAVWALVYAITGGTVTSTSVPSGQWPLWLITSTLATSYLVGVLANREE
ncbi:DUF1360 domain-containing protein [Nonomuraea sp. NPDC050556]|uniref:DUF1360 domain-containing protein n=1 Tax=Nonomuraea sp. NPDC050556 TaxID=3364369 RepID=UPI003793A084